MENRANYALVGLFTLAVLGAAFGFVYWFKRGGESTNRQPFDVDFMGSVSGLVKGAAVRFNGLRVGEVTSINIVPNDPGRVRARIEIDPATPVRSDTLAQLEYQGLTGVASVALTGGAASAPPLVADKGRDVARIEAKRSDYQDILETVQRLSGKIDTVISRVDGAVADSQGSLVKSLKNIEEITGEIKQARVGETLTGIRQFSDVLARNSQKFDNIVAGVEKVFGSGGDGQLKGMMAEFDEMAKSIRILAGNLDKRTAQLTTGLNRFTGPGLRDLEALTAESRKAVSDISRAVRSLEENPQRLLFGGKPAIPEYSR
ncbi:MAG: MCE family protein [Proteobacteria bacterium]|nr:MCE family protein [Pseudomonadota bacterium]